MGARAFHPKPPRNRRLNEAWAGNILPFPRKSPDFFWSPYPLTLSSYPSALLSSLFALPALSSSSTFDPSVHVHLLRFFYLLPSFHAFSMSLSFSVSFSHISFYLFVSIFPIIFLHVFFFIPFSSSRYNILPITDNTMSLRNSTL